MNIKSLVLSALLAFGINTHVEAAEVDALTYNRPVPIVRLLFGCQGPVGYNYVETMARKLNSDKAVTSADSGVIPATCILFYGEEFTWTLQDQQPYKFISSGVDFEGDTFAVYEHIGEPRFRFLAYTGVWIEDKQAEKTRLEEQEDTAHLISIEHVIPDGTPGKLIAACLSLDELSYVIEAKMNGNDPETLNLDCRFFDRKEITQDAVATLNNPVTLTVHLATVSITAYEVSYNGNTFFVLIERDL